MTTPEQLTRARNYLATVSDFGSSAAIRNVEAQDLQRNRQAAGQRESECATTANFYCPTCHGNGQFDGKDCRACGGTGIRRPV